MAKKTAPGVLKTPKLRLPGAQPAFAGNLPWGFYGCLDAAFVCAFRVDEEIVLNT
jgi:hypothetical protein